MDYSFIVKYAPLYLEAAMLTIRIAACGIVGAFVVGIVCCLIRELRLPILSPLIQVYIELSRNTPLLIQLFFLYFGLPKVGIVLSSEACGIVGLIFLGGSYMAEGFRTGIDNVPGIQREAAYSLGLTKPQTFWRIILPQAVATSVPVFCANSIFLIKETSVFSAVALADLMYVTKDLIGLYYKTDEALTMLVISYLLILLPISLVSSWIERRVRYAGYGNTGTL
ncbi:MAG: amino acid ABC transporter permease [Lachnospiraceae bacterium]|nr:amino acid ABC transporter permease [Lachnospiraceae bacterium]MDD7049334.1 amino acid ABC transporter permease [Lachnospiraceae bacterium]MDY3222953.1 amino acid ABC transporter permease [Lachnospiraceae bacterium]MDY4095635.1 amino acid ABC transporter permease [Lachnospiraceae bacterium]